MIELRPYQADALQQARDLIARGRNAPLLVAPTGAGKTVCIAAIAQGHITVDPGNRVLIVAHRTELVEQAARTLVRCGVHMRDVGEIRPGVIQRPTARIQVASTQTLRARNLLPPATLTVYDEAHHYASDDWALLATSYSDAIRIGFTATPMRADGRGLGDAFDSIVQVSTVKELTALGYLVPCRVIAPPPLKAPDLACSPAEAYARHACGRSTVVFADFVKNAEKFAAEFKEAGIEVAIVHGKLSAAARSDAFKAHTRGAVLVNCMVLTEGWDSPATAVCILARGCGSVGTYLQIAGRVLRPHPGKTEALLIDLTGRSVETHGHPDEDREYSLEGKGIRKKGELEGHYCKVCGNTVEAPPNSYPCQSCGFDLPGADRVADPNYLAVELVERYSGKRAEDEPRRIETLARWIAESRAKSHKTWAAVSKYKHVYAAPPPAHILKAATELARFIPTVECESCGKRVAKAYSGQCGKCRFGG